MTEFRSYRIQKAYERQLKGSIRKTKRCNLCDEGEDRSLDRSTKLFWIIRNNYPYSLWDSSRVKEHLMIVPKRCVDSISSFNSEELQEFGQLLQKFESKDFNFYGRNSRSSIKTISHQHTHLLQINNLRIRFIFYLKKPRIRIRS